MLLQAILHLGSTRLPVAIRASTALLHLGSTRLPAAIRVPRPRAILALPVVLLLDILVRTLARLQVATRARPVMAPTPERPGT